MLEEVKWLRDFIITIQVVTTQSSAGLQSLAELAKYNGHPTEQIIEVMRER